MFENLKRHSEFANDLLIPFISPDFLERYEEANDPVIKDVQLRLMYLSAERNYREKLYVDKHGEITKEFVQTSCQRDCDGSIKLFDDISYFWHTCRCKKEGFCLLSPVHKARCHKEEWMKQVFLPGMLPYRLDDVPIDLYHPLIKNRLVQYLNNELETKGITIYGAPGVGKTSTFYLCLNELFKKGKKALFITSGQICKAFFKKDTKLIQQLFEIDYLLIDDLGSEYAVEYTMTMFEEVVCDRYSIGKQCSFTTNLKKEEFISLYPRVFDRQLQTNITMMLPGKSNRKGVE
jgi:DNA replication protein DnaC